MGGTAKAKRARNDARNPLPLRAMAGWRASRVRRAREGMARAALAELTATNPPRPLWPRKSPRPAPTTTAATTTATESSIWLRLRTQMPFVPLALFASQCPTWERKCISGRLAQPEPRHGHPFGQDDYGVGDTGEHHRQHQAHDDGRVEILAEALDDELSQAALADEGGDVHEADGGDRGHAQPREDRGERQRQIDAHELPDGAVSHPPGRLAHVVGHGVEPGQGVSHQDEERVADQDHLGR